MDIMGKSYMLITFESKILKAAVKKVSKGLMRSQYTEKACKLLTFIVTWRVGVSKLKLFSHSLFLSLYFFSSGFSPVLT